MKGNARLTVLIATAALFTLGLSVPDISCLPGGQAQAQTLPPADFTFPAGGAKAEVTYETASCLVDPEYNSTGTISCSNPFDNDSDSYEVNADVDASTQVDLDADVTTNGLSILFFNNTCAQVDADGLPDAINDLSLISAQIIPGNAIHKTSNSKWTMYQFEGNVPNATAGDFDHFEMNLKINNSKPAKSELLVEANTNFCDWADYFNDVTNYAEPLSGPVAMVFDVGNFMGFLPENTADATQDTDYACVSVTPDYRSLDISSAYCPLVGP